MIESLTISVSFNEVEEAHASNYFRFSEISGEFLTTQKPDNTFYFLYINNCDIVSICQSFDWHIVSKDTFNDRLVIGIGLSGKKGINRELYRVQDEITPAPWRDILHFTFESDFVCQFFPYNTHFKGKMCIDRVLYFYIHDYYPTEYEDISAPDRKTSNLIFRFREERQAALVARIFSLCIARMPFFREGVTNVVLIPMLATTRERNLTRFTRFCSLLLYRLKAVDGLRAIQTKENREQTKGTHGQGKLSDLISHPDYLEGQGVFLVDDIVSSNENFTRMKCKLIQPGTKSVTGLLLGKAVRSENQK